MARLGLGVRIARPRLVANMRGSLADDACFCRLETRHWPGPGTSRAALNDVVGSRWTTGGIETNVRPSRMDPSPFFAAQFLWFLCAWSVVAIVFVAPKLRQLPANDALAIAIAPQLFRVLGVGLLVPALAPGMPRSFALPTALGDSATAVLALLAVIALRERWPIARAAAWACNLVGAADLLAALPHAAAVRASTYLAAQWYVPVLVVPLMIVSHAMSFRLLWSSNPKG